MSSNSVSEPPGFRNVPSGTVALLFTDVEGSTQRWESHGEAMGAAVERHDTILLQIIEAHRGYTFKRLGDAFCAAFHTVPDAVAAAHAAQRALLTEDFSAVNGLRVRMALHAGRTEERGGDYFGPTVNRTARLLSIGSGGQVLVSGIAADLLRNEMAAETSLRDLGSHRLRDLSRPERVYQFVAPDLPQEFPALRSVDARANNLPLQLTSFVGREDEIAQIKASLEKHRLVTLIGAGGVGKTRLAIQVGADLLDRYDDGVWLVELAPFSNEAQITEELARIFGVQASAERLPETLLGALRQKRVLLIIDNCEHLVEATARVVDKILRGSPALQVLATSREPLKVSGESAHRVASLDMPAAISLFKDRASEANDRFEVTDANLATVKKICERLDGIALAIELAAARVRAIDVDKLLVLLEERFRVLTGGNRSALPRQQTMRALIDWSHDLLSPQEQILFRRLAVFNGGWPLEAAYAVCSGEELEEWDVFDFLSALVDKSLVVADLGTGRPRYRFLESTRHYAMEKLVAAGEHDAMRAAHARYFTAFAQDMERSWTTTPSGSWTLEVEPEMDNVRAAIDWALAEQHDVELGAQLIAALQPYWNEHRFEGERYVTQALTFEPVLTPSAVASLWLAAAAVRLTASFQSARESAQRAKVCYDALGDESGAMRALRWVGVTSVFLRDLEPARDALTLALAYFEAHDEGRWANWCVGGLANAANFSGDVVLARDLYDRGMRQAHLQGDDFMESACRLSLAECEYQAGNVTRAIDLARESIARDRTLRWPRTLPNTLANLAAYFVRSGDVEAARDAANEALRTAVDAQERQLVGFAVQHLAAVAALRGEHERSALLLGFTNAVFTASMPREYTEQSEYDALLPRLNQTLGEQSAKRLLKRGEGLTQEEAVAEALSI